MILIIIIIIVIIFFLNFNSCFNFCYRIIKDTGIGYYFYNKLSTHNIISSQNEIIKNLWIGDYKSALNKEFLIKNNIKLIINCSKKLDFTDLENIIKIRLSMNDDRKEISDQKMIELFPTVYDIIDNNLKNNNGVLVHCKAGMQRSATIVALYLMKKNNMNFEEVKKIIRNKRNIVFRPYINFIKPIKYFESKFN